MVTAFDVARGLAFCGYGAIVCTIREGETICCGRSGRSIIAVMLRHQM